MPYEVRPFVEYDDSIESAPDNPEGNEYIANLATIHGVTIEWAVYRIDDDGFHEWQSDHVTRDEAYAAMWDRGTRDIIDRHLA